MPRPLAAKSTGEHGANLTPPAFFNMLKEPLLVQKQTIPHMNAGYFGFSEPLYVLIQIWVMHPVVRSERGILVP